jgi:hypothetical protein
MQEAGGPSPKEDESDDTLEDQKKKIDMMKP